MNRATARLHLLLAQEGRYGLVIRHGTAKSVCTLLWDRKKDLFSLGQWLRGRIDTHTCDLSPDGKYFLYAATNTRTPMWETKSWTVLSQAPFLKAMAYYPGCSHGGCFLSYSTYWIQGFHPSERDLEFAALRRKDAAEGDAISGVDLYERRLLAGGWFPDPSPPLSRKAPKKFIRNLAVDWTLHHSARGGYRLLCGDSSVDTKSWDWADLDGDRLVWTSGGCLWTGKLGPKSILNPRQIHDFNGMQFQAIAAPYSGGKPATTLAPPKSSSVVAARVLLPRPPLAEKKKKPDRSKVKPDEDD
jgi:hypothetical protein